MPEIATNMFRVPALIYTLRNPLSLQIRNFKSDLKIKWVKPVKIPSIDPAKSGDLRPLEHINLKVPPPELTNSEELKTASDTVKRLFTLEFFSRKKAMDVLRKDMVRAVRRHESDWGSLECYIANMTACIRDFQNAFAQNPYNRKLKVDLKELIERRKKFLKYLRRSDYKKFEWLLEKLDLQYRPPPSHFHWIARKESLRKLTDKYCEDLRQERLQAYKEKLESQKLEFLTEKFSKLMWIMEEEKACGVEPTVTQSDIEKVKNQLEEMKMIKKESVREDKDE